jgi:hypothetical protein
MLEPGSLLAGPLTVEWALLTAPDALAGWSSDPRSAGFPAAGFLVDMKLRKGDDSGETNGFPER